MSELVLGWGDMLKRYYERLGGVAVRPIEYEQPVGRIIGLHREATALKDKLQSLNGTCDPNKCALGERLRWMHSVAVATIMSRGLRDFED